MLTMAINGQIREERLVLTHQPCAHTLGQVHVLILRNSSSYYYTYAAVIEHGNYHSLYQLGTGGRTQAQPVQGGTYKQMT